MKKIRQLFLHPSTFFEEIKKGRLAWRFSLGIFGFALVAAGFFYAFKPQGFPQDSFSASAGTHSLGFWLAISFLGGLFTAASGAIVWIALRFLEGKFKISLPQILYVLFVCHIWYIVLFASLALACAVRSPSLYKASELVFSLAGFVFTIMGIKLTADSSVPRVFVSLLVSSLGIVAFLFALHLGGLLPADILKVLLFV